MKFTLAPRSMFSVACRSIPRPNGDGADGCGRGWTQPADAPLKCEVCGRRLVITDEFVEIPLTDLAR